MGVVAFPNISPQGPGARIDWELRSNTARFPSALTGYTRTLERPGGHFAATLSYQNLNGANAARLRAFLAACRGQAQRFYLRDFGYTQRGSFPAPELLNSTASTSGWGVGGTAAVLTASDGILRCTQTSYTTNPQVRQSAIAVTQYAPYAIRGLVLHGRGSTQAYRSGLLDGTVAGDSAPGAGMRYAMLVPAASTADAYIYNNGVNIGTAGDYFELGFASAARCALVDNGPNFHQRSDEIDNAYWNKSEVTIGTNNGTAPDGTNTMDTMVETTASGQHFFNRSDTRTSQAEDWCVYGVFRRGVGSRNIGLVIGRDGTNFVRAIFDLGAGTVQSAVVSGDTTNPRAFIRDMGGGAYFCAAVGRLTASTGLMTQVDLVSGSTVSYAGDGASGVHCWRVGAAQSSVPTRGMQTTTAGDADGVAQTGGALHLKGLPVSTTGLLLADDLAEIITPSGSQFVRALNSLNSDAAGLGYFQFEPPLRESPADNAGVVICNPLMRAMLDDRTVRWSQRHAGFVDLEFTAVEDMTA